MSRATHNQRTSWRLRSVLLLILVVGAIPLVWLGASNSTLAVAGGPYRIKGTIALVAGIVAILVSPVVAFRWTRLAPTLGIVTWSVSILLLAVYRPPSRGDINVDVPLLEEGRDRVWKSKYDWFEKSTRSDDRFGHAGIPSGVFREVHRDFDVLYTHDSEGFRVMPPPVTASPVGEIVFVGCSYTYGVGVADDETFPAILAREAWPEYRVRNVSYSGWGTNHAHEAVARELESASKPNAIIYGFIPHQLVRNYQRESWFANRYCERPLFDVDEDGSLQFLGMQHSDLAKAPDSDETDAKEVAITIALLRDMAAQCKEADVPLFLLLLQPTDPTLVEKFESIPDLTVLDRSYDCFEVHPIDTHPRPNWHRRIAHGLASDARIAQIAGLPDLLRPDSVSLEGLPPALPYFRLSRPDWNATFVEVGSPPSLWRVESAELKNPEKWSIQLNDRSFAFREGEAYTVRFHARAKTPCTIEVNIASHEGVWGGAGGVHDKKIETQWQQYEVPFVATRTTDQGVVTFNLGLATFPIELKEIQVFHDDREMQPYFGRKTVDRKSSG